MPETRAPDFTPVLAQFADDRASLIPLLQAIQATFYYLPEEALRRVARKLRVPITEVYQVATFYRCFSLKPRGRHLVQVCLGTACHVRAGDLILERAQSETGAALNGTSPDLEFTVEPVRCLGCCGLAPVMRVDRDTFAHLEQAKVRGVLNRYRPKRKPAAARAGLPTPPTAQESAAHD
ncbi:MAG TPA: NAD(P)H-dependent oxidoreductase subunit E [Terriglobales bacterium]|nr:NAD(P)H-dependent oxidoreductase subunit E [Terriglobales bacterium]